uniref:EXS domain-containing protein n=1 Tax=Brassica oleracea TaxID=3712 RepID=A0A3P6EDM1_BRAOL|nr:unnamed protein product [Brassica oleracea]
MRFLSYSGSCCDNPHQNSLQEDGQEIYMNTMFRLYSWFGFVMLHIMVYAANIYYWRRYRINYSKIFGFKQGTELGHRQVLLVAFSIGVFALLCVLANLDMEVDPETKDYQAFTELLPLFLLIGIFGVLYLPFDFFYHSKRKFYLTCMFHCIAAPFMRYHLLIASWAINSLARFKLFEASSSTYVTMVGVTSNTERTLVPSLMRTMVSSSLLLSSLSSLASFSACDDWLMIKNGSQVERTQVLLDNSGGLLQNC